MKLSTRLASSLSLIVSLNAFAASPSQEVSLGTVTATAKIEQICGFTIDRNNADFAFGPNGVAKNAARITATANFNAYYGIKVSFAEAQLAKFGLKWIAQSESGKKVEFTPNSTEGFKQVNDSGKVRKLEIDLFPRLSNIKHEMEMDAGEFASVATITMKCHQDPI